MNILESLTSLAAYTGFDNKTHTHRLGLSDNDKIIITQRSKIPNCEWLTHISYDLNKIGAFLEKKERKINNILMSKNFKDNDQLFSNIAHIFLKTCYLENVTDQQKQFLCEVIKKNGFSRLVFVFQRLKQCCRNGGNFQDFITQFEKYCEYFPADGLFRLWKTVSLDSPDGLVSNFSKFIPFFSKEPSQENVSICEFMYKLSSEEQQQVIDIYNKLVETCEHDGSSQEEMSTAFRSCLILQTQSSYSKNDMFSTLFKTIPEHIDDQIRWKKLILSLNYRYNYIEHVEFLKNWSICLNLPGMTLSKLLTDLSKFLPYTSVIGALSIFVKSQGQEDKLLELMEDLKDDLIPSKDSFDMMFPLISLISGESVDGEKIHIDHHIDHVDPCEIVLNLLDVPRVKRLQIAKMLKDVTELPLGYAVRLLSLKRYPEETEEVKILLENLPDYLLKYLPFFTGFFNKPKQELLQDIHYIPELIIALFYFENVWKNEGNSDAEINKKSEYFGELLEKFKHFRKIPYFIESDGVEEAGIGEEIEVDEEFKEKKVIRVEREKTENSFPMERFLKFLEKNKFEKMTLEEMHVFLNGEKTENLMEDWSNYYDIPSNRKNAQKSKVLN